MFFRHLFAPLNSFRPGATPLSTRAGIAIVVAAFAIVQGPRVIHNLPKWHWEDGRHFHHNRQQVHSIADCFLVPSAWEGGAESTYRPLSANLYYLAGRSGTAPFVVLADRLFIRYTYFGHAGLAVATGGLAAVAAHWLRGRHPAAADTPSALAAGA